MAEQLIQEEVIEKQRSADLKEKKKNKKKKSKSKKKDEVRPGNFAALRSMASCESTDLHDPTGTFDEEDDVDMLGLIDYDEESEEEDGLVLLSPPVHAGSVSDRLDSLGSADQTDAVCKTLFGLKVTRNYLDFNPNALTTPVRSPGVRGEEAAEQPSAQLGGRRYTPDPSVAARFRIYPNDSEENSSGRPGADQIHPKTVTTQPEPVTT